jgi:predicted nucleic acid-binding protein
VTRLLDVNLLMALLWENHEHHTHARSWLMGISAFATCPVAQLGFARVSSHPLLGYGNINSRITTVASAPSELRCQLV